MELLYSNSNQFNLKRSVVNLLLYSPSVCLFSLCLFLFFSLPPGCHHAERGDGARARGDHVQPVFAKRAAPRHPSRLALTK